MTRPLAELVDAAGETTVTLVRGWLAAHPGTGPAAVADLLDRGVHGMSPALPADTRLTMALSALRRPQLLELVALLREGHVGPILGGGSVRRLLGALADAVDAAVGHLDAQHERLEALEDERSEEGWG